MADKTQTDSSNQAANGNFVSIRLPVAVNLSLPPNGIYQLLELSKASFVNKYGGIMPKKKPLISKDNERAYFDSADWALGKQGVNFGQKTRDPVETLRPKLQRTPRHQLPPRRPACTTVNDN